MVVTKVENTDADEEVIEYIAGFLMEVRDQLEETSAQGELEPRLFLLDELLQKNSNGSFSRIAIFRKPKQEGYLSENPEIQNNKESIETKILSLPQFWL